MFEWTRWQSAFFPMPFSGLCAFVAEVNSTFDCLVRNFLHGACFIRHAVPSFFAIFLPPVCIFALACFLPEGAPGQVFRAVFLNALKNFLLVGIDHLLTFSTICSAIS